MFRLISIGHILLTISLQFKQLMLVIKRSNELTCVLGNMWSNHN